MASGFVFEDVYSKVVGLDPSMSPAIYSLVYIVSLTFKFSEISKFMIAASECSKGLGKARYLPWGISDCG